MKIYVVFGSTGEYSDRSEWPVMAYYNEADAKQHVTKATEYADAWSAATRGDDWYELGWEEQTKRMKESNPLDPSFECEYTGTRYYYAEVELKEAFSAPEPIH